MESMTVASFSVAETAPIGRKVATPKPDRRPSLVRADALAFLKTDASAVVTALIGMRMRRLKRASDRSTARMRSTISLV
jgi:hypothetical protein